MKNHQRLLVLFFIFVIFFACMKASEAATWNEFKQDHHATIYRDNPGLPYLGAITPEWLVVHAEWRHDVRLRTAHWYHVWQDEQSLVSGVGSGSWGVLTWRNADQVADCESGGDWAANTGNGYYGGLQFKLSTWLAWGGGAFNGVGPFPFSREQQIGVALGHSLSAWPTCGKGLA